MLGCCDAVFIFFFVSFLCEGETFHALKRASPAHALTQAARVNSTLLFGPRTTDNVRKTVVAYSKNE